MPEVADAQETAGVIAPPPLIVLGGLALAITANWLYPIPWTTFRFRPSIGALLVVAAVVLMMASIRELRAADTPVQTRQPTRAIISTGPYRFSRNPVYLSFAILQLGIAVWTGSAWFLVSLVLTMLVITMGVIMREERYLERKFGDIYIGYKRKVRRWL
jgi:protein-S-isoprenylcysteine O-methyltransferase Ste14